jgi:hypothetical protein
MSRGMKPTYAVYEVEVQRAYEVSGMKFRIAVLNGVMDGTNFGEIWFDGKSIHGGFPRSGEGLGNDGLNFEQRRKLKVGDSLSLTTGDVTLSSIFANADIKLLSLGKMPAVYSVKLLKSCDAQVELDQYSKVTWGGGGIIAIPRRKVHERFSISRPPCFEESDRTVSLGKIAIADPAVEKQVAQAKAESEILEAKVRRDRSRNELMMKITSDKIAEARKLAKDSSWRRSDSQTFEDQLRNSICPETIALARISHIQRVTADRTESERTNHADGSYSIRHESSITLEFEDGHKEKLTVALGKLKITEGIKSITVRADGCADIEPQASRTSRQDEIVSDISDVLKNHFTRQIQNDAYEFARKQFPAD